MDEDLSDGQIEKLLTRATARLQQKDNTQELATSHPKQHFNFPKLNTGKLEKPYISTKGDVATVDAKRLLEEKQRKQANMVRKVEDPMMVKKAAIETKKATAGTQWFNLPRTDLTPQLKRDLQLLKMRNVLDPHRHYKKDGGKMQAPEYSQVGTIIEGPTEFFSGRIENKQRKKTFVEEVLAGEQETGRFKRKYGELQGRKTSGKKAFYKAMKANRKIGGVKKGSG
ncbi:dTDP-fucopyranose mutase [Friedmanniomyces endolithicus]|uniref:dTDP-fucopyranose mutase n=1 Tax=Friedmanniomyces endolithicus TaxID=329885 RepID=A0AAN6KDP5_9PEZI|nr:dTDP-fucopyranose mutase [Friedmanniomyces endolithicus]KAK0809426.1 dTDP-fucopyranose mutase [Friedmanniomyces endolithicus]KAK0819760.1 dTDP-fucopyranose mutase [Friedmanniomyces endolithicus]KAK0858201.1 dTDP-fucopyranose mutase [Friedmanniomyces endolithicus]KAK0873362.1 dTDP-fucopyranose mutase [Friedmanniomyces endolithicus]